MGLQRRARLFGAFSSFAISFALVACGSTCAGEPQPPAPPLPRDLPPEVIASFPQNDRGQPILHSTRFAGEGSLRLVYDRDLDDPLARWGQCLGRVVACYRTNEGPIDGCIELIERCADDRGGEGCCPAQCIDEFRAKNSSGASEKEAIDASFVHGGCIRGFREQIAAIETEVEL